MIARVAVALVLVLVVPNVAVADELDPGSGGLPTPAPISVPPGLYLVTDVYAGSVVSTYGATTIYSTMTVRASPGTYARVLDVVGTGVASAFDGRSFNGRGRLGDGRQIAGAYYETYVRGASGFTPVNVVFFQDDSETRALVAPTPSSAIPTAAPALPTAVPTTGPIRTPSAPTMPPVPVVAAAVALASDGPALAAIDVLRGRVVHLWPRAFADGRPVAVRSWRLVSGRADQLSRSSGSGSESADVAWLDPASGLALSFEVTDAVYGRTALASLSVSVRSPALVQ